MDYTQNEFFTRLDFYPSIERALFDFDRMIADFMTKPDHMHAIFAGPNMHAIFLSSESITVHRYGDEIDAFNEAEMNLYNSEIVREAASNANRTSKQTEGSTNTETEAELSENETEPAPSGQPEGNANTETEAELSESETELSESEAELSESETELSESETELSESETEPAPSGQSEGNTNTETEAELSENETELSSRTEPAPSGQPEGSTNTETEAELSENETELTGRTEPAAQEQTQSNTATTTEAEAEQEEDIHSRWMNSGIDTEEYDKLKHKINPKNQPFLYTEENFLNGTKLLSHLAGVDLNIESPYADFRRALDKLVINGKSAEEVFGLKDNMTRNNLKDDVIPKFAQAVAGVVNSTGIDSRGDKRTFIFIKEDDGSIKPLKLNAEKMSHTREAANTGNLEDVRDRLLSEKEVKDALLNEGRSKMFSSEKDKKGTDYETVTEDKILQRLNSEKYSSSFNTLTDDEKSELRNTVMDISNMTNLALMTEYESIYRHAITGIKSAPTYQNELEAEINSLSLQTRYKGYNKSELEKEAEKNVVDKHIFGDNGAAEGIRLNIIKEDYDRRMNYIVGGIANDIDHKVSVIRAKNLKNYNEYQFEKLTREGSDLHEDLKTRAEEYNALVDVYEKAVQNKVLTDDEKAILDNMGKENLPDVKFSLDDLADPVSIMKAIKEKGISYDNVMIDGQSLKEMLHESISGKPINTLTEKDLEIASRTASFRKKLFDKVDAIIHPNNHLDHIDPVTHELVIPILTIKTPAGEMVPEITAGKELKPLPKVDELSDFKKKLYRQKTIDSNKKAVDEYRASVERSEQRQYDNEVLDDINDSMKIRFREAQQYRNYVQSRSLSDFEAQNNSSNNLRPTSFEAGLNQPTAENTNTI